VFFFFSFFLFFFFFFFFFFPSFFFFFLSFCELEKIVFFFTYVFPYPPPPPPPPQPTPPLSPPPPPPHTPVCPVPSFLKTDVKKVYCQVQQFFRNLLSFSTPSFLTSDLDAVCPRDVSRCVRPPLPFDVVPIFGLDLFMYGSLSAGFHHRLTSLVGSFHVDASAL